MSMEQNQQKAKHLSFQSIFCFLSTLCRNRTVQDIFFSSVLNLQKFCCCRFQKKLFGGKNETGRKKIYTFLKSICQGWDVESSLLAKSTDIFLKTSGKS